MKRDERGFTLIEMIVTLMLMGVVVATIGESLILMFKTTEETTQRLSESPDLQIAAAYFGGDVQSAKTVEIGSASFTTTCGNLPAGATRVLNLSWTDPGSDPTSAGDTARIATYVVEPVVNQKQLVRYYCSGSAAPDSATLVNYVDPTTTPAAECVPTGCAAATSVRLPLSICTADTTGRCDGPVLEFELKATRRAP